MCQDTDTKYKLSPQKFLSWLVQFWRCSLTLERLTELSGTNTLLNLSDSDLILTEVNPGVFLSLGTCSPQRRPLFVVGVESFGEGMRLKQTVQQLEEVRGGHVSVHALIWTGVACLGLRLFQSVSLTGGYF